MSDKEDHILAFMSSMGVEAEFSIRDNGEKLIAIQTERYNQRREWIEAWFTLVEQHRDYSYFRERLRGTGQTA